MSEYQHDYITSDEDEDIQNRSYHSVIDLSSDASNAVPDAAESENDLFIEDESSNEVFNIDERIKQVEKNSDDSEQSLNGWNISKIEKKRENTIYNNNNTSSLSTNDEFNVQNKNNCIKINKDNDDIICLDDDEVSSSQIHEQIEQIQHDYVSKTDLNKEKPDNNSILIADVNDEPLNLTTDIESTKSPLNLNESSQQIISSTESKQDDSSLESNNSSKKPTNVNKCSSSQENNNSQSIKCVNNDKKLDQLPTVMLKKLSNEEIKSFTKKEAPITLKIVRDKNSSSYKSINIVNEKYTDTKTVNNKKRILLNDLISSEDSNDSEKITVKRRKPNLNTSISSSTTSKDSNKEETKKVTKTINTKEIASSKKKENIQPTNIITSLASNKLENKIQPTPSASASSSSSSKSEIKIQKNKQNLDLNIKKSKPVESNKIQKIETAKIKPKSPSKLLSNFKIPKVQYTNETQSSTVSSSLKKSSELVKKSTNTLKSKKSSPLKSNTVTNHQDKKKEATTTTTTTTTNKNIIQSKKAITTNSSRPTSNSQSTAIPISSNQKPKNDFLSLLNKNDDKNKNKSTPTSQIRNETSLNKLDEIRLNHNKSYGWNHPAFSLSFLVNHYIQDFSKMAGSLDFDFLNSQTKKTNKPFCVHQLNNDERLELCKLMSRTAGRLNTYSMFGIDYTLLENTNTRIDFKKYGKHAENMSKYLPLEFENDAEENQFAINEISKLPIGVSYMVYEHFSQRFSSPWRKCHFYYNTELNSHSIKISFQNDKVIESEDASIEACVKFICHKNKYDYSVNINYVIGQANENEQEIEPDLQKIKKINEVKEKMNDIEVFDQTYVNHFLTKLKKTYSGPITDHGVNYYHVNFSEDAYPIIDRTNSNFIKKVNNNEIEFPKYNDQRFNRFTSNLNKNRGATRYAYEHKQLSPDEYNRRLKTIKENKTDNNQVNLTGLFD